MNGIVARNLLRKDGNITTQSILGHRKLIWQSGRRLLILEPPKIVEIYTNHQDLVALETTIQLLRIKTVFLYMIYHLALHTQAVYLRRQEPLVPQREVSGFLVGGHLREKLRDLGPREQKKPARANRLVLVQMMTGTHSPSRPIARVIKKKPSQIPKNVKFDDSNE
jgi:hypothetical protein